MKRVSGIFAVVSLIGMIIAGTGVAADTSFREFRLTSTTVTFTDDWEAAVKQEFGESAEVADFADLKARFSGQIAAFCDAVGLPDYGSRAYCLYNGTKYDGYYDGNQRIYFMERHNGNKPDHFLAHEHIDNYTLSLGSWFGTMLRPVLAWVPCYELSITLDPADGGTVTVTPDKECYDDGEQVQVWAQPAHDRNYRFGAWTGSFSGFESKMNIIMDSDKEVTAHFLQMPPSSQKGNHGELNDPINTATGELFFESTDLELGGPMALVFGRHYGSRVHLTEDLARDFGHILGDNWLHNFMMEIIPVGVSKKRVILTYGLILDFEWTQGSEWQLTGPSQAPYQLRQGESGRFYLMDPARDLVYIFDGSNRVEQIQDRNGNALTFTYDSELSEVSDGLGRSFHFAYEPGGSRLIQVCGLGKCIQFGYAEGSPLSTFTDAAGNVTTYEYHDGNLITGTILPQGNTPYVQGYDIHGIVAYQDDAYGNRTAMAFEGDNNSVTRIDRPDNTSIRHQHIDKTRLSAYTDPEGTTVCLGYDDSDRRTAIDDRMGGSTQVAYHDQSGKIASITNARAEVLAYTYTAQNQTFSDPDTHTDSVNLTFYNLARIDYPDGTWETFGHDARGNIVSRTDQAGKTWNYTYNDRGQVLTAANPEGGVSTYAYNGDGTLATSTDSDTGVTAYGYDAMKRLVQITRPGGATVQTAYDLSDRIIAITDERSKTYTYAYDANGNIAAITDPDMNQTAFSHDLMDLMEETTDARGKKTRFAYDAMNRLQSVTDPNGNMTHFGYNPHGWRDSITDGAGKNWQTGYDMEGRSVSHTSPLGRTTAIARNQLGHVTGIRNPLNQESTFMRDAMSRVTKITDPLSRETAFSYDANGLLTNVTLPTGSSTQYARNGLGLVERIMDLKGSQWVFGHTSMGRLLGLMDPMGNIWRYGYDEWGRRNQVSYPYGSAQIRTYDDAGNLLQSQYSVGPDLAFTYDNQNRLLTGQHIAFAYNETGQVLTTTHSGTGFGAAYDDGGRVQTATYANGHFSVTYAYDARDLLTRVSDTLTGAAIDFSYDDDGRLTAMTRSNGANTMVTWDGASRLTRIQHAGLADLQYTYNAAGEATRMDYDLPLDPADYLISGTDQFAYDAASQIATAGYAYDAQGRQIAAPGQIFTWDGAGRLITANDAVMTYNGLNDLVTRLGAGTTVRYYTNYALGLHPVVSEKNENTGDWRRFYVLTPGGQLLYLIDVAAGNQVLFYHYDRSGNTLFLTSATGEITDAYAYSPYGRLLAHQGTSDQPFTFVGEWQVRQEGRTGLYQMRERYYDAVAARFLSREPLWPTIEEPQSLNPYQYAWNNPLRFVDREGAFVETWEKIARARVTMTPAEYAKVRALKDAAKGDSLTKAQEEAFRADLADYTKKWMLKNIGDPDKYELTPQQYGELKMLEAPSIMDSKRHRELADDITRYAKEHAMRHGKAHVGQGEAMDKFQPNVAESKRSVFTAAESPRPVFTGLESKR